MNKPSQKRLEAERIKLAEPGIRDAEIARRLGVTSGTVWAWWHPTERAAHNRRWAEKNREKRRRYFREYYKKNRAKRLAERRASYLRNRDAILANAKAKHKASKAQ